MASKKKTENVQTNAEIKPPLLKLNQSVYLYLFGAAYFIIAAALTFPLIFRMNSSIYGPYDHVTTDLFANINIYFWWLKESIFHLKISPFNDSYIAAPFSTKLAFVNLTGFLQLPITLIFGDLFSRNFAILFNLVVSALGMFFLVRHLTKSNGAAFISGIIFAFCPNMLVRSYTTYDSTQVQWIPFYTLFVLRYLENRTWKNIIIAGAFLLLHVVMSFPYYLVYLPIHTTVLLGTFAAWYCVGKNKSPKTLLRILSSKESLIAFFRAGIIVFVCFILFVIYFKIVVGGDTTMESFKRTTEQLQELSLAPTDYMMPHPSSALLKSDVKETYWDADRPGKDPDSFVAYIGYVAIILSLIGAFTVKGPVKWFFISGGFVAFISTLGPTLFGILTPSGFIHSFYAPFARRILIYKVFVQFSIAGLAGFGIATILKWIKESFVSTAFIALIAVMILAEYALVPPAMSVNLTKKPLLYDKIAALPDSSIIIEVPVLRNNGLPYQGYLYYQTKHHKRLFNPQLGVSGVPERLKPFYKQMEVPLEAADYSNLAAMRYLGVTHLTYHWYIGTSTVGFRSFIVPALYNVAVKGLKTLYENREDPNKNFFTFPYDYTFADLYEITAEPVPIALVYDYCSPYKQITEVIPSKLKEDFQTKIGWVSPLLDSTKTMYYPIPQGEISERLIKQGGKISAVNISDKPVDFSVEFFAKAPDEGRILSVEFNGKKLSTYQIGPDSVLCRIDSMHLDGSQTGTMVFNTNLPEYNYRVLEGSLPVAAVLMNFRVYMKN